LRDWQMLPGWPRRHGVTEKSVTAFNAETAEIAEARREKNLNREAREGRE